MGYIIIDSQRAANTASWALQIPLSGIYQGGIDRSSCNGECNCI